MVYTCVGGQLHERLFAICWGLYSFLFLLILVTALVVMWIFCMIVEVVEEVLPWSHKE